MKVINLIAGPGAGKSTTMAGVFHKLKKLGINAEQTPEWLKKAAWEGRGEVFKSPGYLLHNQAYELHILRDKVEVIVSDSPLIIYGVYPKIYPSEYNTIDWLDHSFKLFEMYDNLNFYVDRTKPYNPSGRNQNKEEAIILDKAIKEMLDERNVDYTVLKDDDYIVDRIVEMYLKWSKK